MTEQMFDLIRRHRASSKKQQPTDHRSYSQSIVSHSLTQVPMIQEGSSHAVKARRHPVQRTDYVPIPQDKLQQAQHFIADLVPAQPVARRSSERSGSRIDSSDLVLPVRSHSSNITLSPESDSSIRAHVEATVHSHFQSPYADYLNLEAAQTVQIIRTPNSTFYYGSCTGTSGLTRYGYFPKSCVTLLGDVPMPSTSPHSVSTPAQFHTAPTSESSLCGTQCTLRQIAKIDLDPSPLKPISMSPDTSLLGDITATASRIFADLKPWQTRLIKLKSGFESDDLKCNLLVVDLIDGQGCAIADSSEIVDYGALSYSWGPDKSMARISVNDLDWTVPTELATALLYLRDKDRDMYLWCDALCINQQNSSEKASQIRSMLRIFEKACYVIAWLGVPQPSSGRLVKTFELISPEEDLSNQGHDKSCLEALEGLRIALRFHLSSQWFLRTWVRQEVFAAKKLVLCTGGHKVTFDLFSRKFDAVHLLCSPEPGVRLALPIERPRTLSVLQQEFQHFGTDRFDFVRPNHQREFSEYWLSVLSYGPLFGVSEERDRIYGSLGILTSSVTKSFARLPRNIDGILAQFPISYDASKPLGEVFGDVTRFLVNITGMANVLDIWRTPKARRKPCPGLASWAMDWRYFGGIVLPSVISRGQRYERMDFVDQPQQQYHPQSPLKLRGVRLTTAFQQIQALGGNVDRTTASEPSLVDQVLNNSTSKEKKTVTFWIEEKDSQFMAHGMELDFREIPEIADSIRSGHYCLASADTLWGFDGDVPGHFVAPQTAQLNDVVVSFYGSQYPHLIRSNVEDDAGASYVYLGPVLPVVLDNSQFATLPSKLLRQGQEQGHWSFLAPARWTGKTRTETFDLV